MSRYATEPVYAHGTPLRTGLLLINLGTPEAPTPGAVRRYLREFLSDPRVVEIPRPIWWVILNLFILTTRPRDSASRYAQVWMTDGSPLKVYTERQTKLLQGLLGERGLKNVVVDYAMRYGQPSIASRIAALREQSCDSIVILPLYPQYSASTTATAFDEAFRALSRLRNQPSVRTARNFHDDPGYIAALAASVRDYWTANGRPDKLVMSFHGVPRRALSLGDPYHCECLKTGRLLAEALGLGPEQALVTFQSRFGRAEWLKPYTAEVLERLGAEKTARIDVVCPGFVSDCLETLEEIALEGKATFLKAGGGQYHYIPCLNDRHDWIAALADIASTHLHGWTTPADPAALDAQRARATAVGAGK